MDDQRSALVEVVECDTHEAYRVDHADVEDLEWSDALPTEPDVALKGALAEIAPELGDLLAFERDYDTADEIRFVGRFDDGSIHGVVTMISAGSPPRWAVISTAVCTLEEVPEPDPEDEDEYDDIDDVLESPDDRPPV